MSPSPVWSQLLHDHTHSGRSAWFGPAAYSAGWTKTGIGPVAGVAVAPNGNLVFTSRGRTVTCIDAAGGPVWTFATDRPVLSSPPVVDSAGIAYVTDGSVYAINPDGSQAWKYPAAGPTTTAPAAMTLGPDGTLYVLTTTIAGQPNYLVALATGTTPTLKWQVQLPLQTLSTPACDASGNLYLGGNDGILRALDAATGTLRWTWAGPAGSTIPIPPSVAGDGTVYAGVQHADAAKNALVAITPGATPTLLWQYVPSPAEYLNGGSAPAIGPDGTIYVGFQSLHAVSPGGQKKWSSASSTTQVAPGVPAVAADGSVYVTTADGTLWCYAGDGTVTWQAAAAAPGGIPSLSRSGAVYVGTNGDSLVATAAAPPVGPRLATLYYGLAATRAVVGSQVTYTVDSSSVTDAGIWALLPPALGASQAVVTGDADALSIENGAVVLTGSSTFLGVASTVTLTFGPAAGDAVSLSFEARGPDGTTLAQMFPVLASTFYSTVGFTAPVVTSSSTTGQPVPAGWSFAASTDSAQTSLVTTARLLGLSGAQPVTGTIRLAGSIPLVDLAVGAACPILLSGDYALTCRMYLESAALDDEGGGDPGVVPSVAVRSSTTVGGHLVDLRAEMPLAKGVAALTATFPPAAAPSVGLSDLDLWNGPQGEIDQAVPPSLRSAASFGLESIGIGFDTEALDVGWIAFRISAPDWSALSANGVGIDLDVTDIRLDVWCASPFDDPQVRGRLSGTIDTTIHTEGGTGSTASFDVAAVAPDFQIFGSLAAGTTLRPLDVLSAMSGTTISLPGGLPSPSITALDLYAVPPYGTFSFRMESELDWTLFTVGSVSFTLLTLGVAVERVQRTNDTSHPVIGVILTGGVSLGEYTFELAASSPAGSEGWQFEANLGAPVALPTIRSLVSTFNPSWANALPAEVSNLGQGIVLKELAASVGQNSTDPRSISVSIGNASDSSWTGWHVITTPVAVTLAEVDVEMTADSTAGFSGTIRGLFALGGGTVALRVSLPFATGGFTMTYDSGNEGLTLPGLSSLVQLVNPSWTLPAQVQSIGSDIDLDHFTFTITVATSNDTTNTTLDVALEAADPAHPWVIIPGSPHPILSLAGIKVALQTGTAVATSGSIAGTVTIGSGSLPLVVSMKDGWETYTIALDTSTAPVQLPTVGDVVSLLSTQLAAALPTAVAQWGSNIHVTKFAVTVASSGTTVDAAVGAASPTTTWYPIPSFQQFGLQGLSLAVSGGIGGPPAVTGFVAGTIVVGSNGRIPLRVSLADDMSTFEVSLDPSTPATLPTVADIANLFDASWGAALPSEIATIGQGMQLRTFDLSVGTAASSVDVAIGTPAGWTWAPVPAAADVLTFTSAGIAFHDGSGSSASGSVTSSVTLFGLPVDFELQVPAAVFDATIGTGQLNLGALVNYAFGVTGPSWLSGIGLLSVHLSARFRDGVYTLGCITASDVSLPTGGTLSAAEVLVQFGPGPGDVKVCLKTTWKLASGSEVSGELCYPFDVFEPVGPDGEPTNEPIEGFPPEGPPPVPPPAYATVAELVAALLAAGLAAGAIAAIASYSKNAQPTDVAQALLAQGKPLSDVAVALVQTFPKYAGAPTVLAADLKTAADAAGVGVTASAMVGALVAAYPAIAAGTVAPIVTAMFGLTAVTVAAALKGSYGLNAVAVQLHAQFGPTAAQMIDDLAQGWAPTTVSAADMVGALAAAGYAPAACAAPIKVAYPSSATTAAAFIQMFLGAGFAPPLTAPVAAQVVAAASFGAADALAGLQGTFASDVATLPQAAVVLEQAPYAAADVTPPLKAAFPDAAAQPGPMAAALAGAGYTATVAAPALYASYSAALPGPADMLTVLMGAWPTLVVADAAAALAASSYAAVSTAQALKSKYPQAVATAVQMATVLTGAYGSALLLPGLLLALAAASFPAYEVAPAAAPHYPPAPPASDMATGLVAAYPTLDPAQLGAALAQTPFPGTDVTAGITAALPTTPGPVATMVGAVTTGFGFATLLTAAAAAYSAGTTPWQIARDLVAATPSADPVAVTLVIDSVATSPNLGTPELAAAVFPAWTTPDVKELGVALLLVSWSTTDALCAAIVAGMGGGAAPTPAAIAPALAYAYSQLGAPLDAMALGTGLVSGYAMAGSAVPGATDVAAAIVQALPATGVPDLVTALAAAYASPPLAPPLCAIATRQALTLAKDQPLALAEAMASAFSIGQCPVGTPVMSLAMLVAGFDLVAVSAAFKQVMQGWTVEEYGVLLGVYTDAQWPAAWALAAQGKSAQEVATAIQPEYHLAAADLVALLVGSNDLVDHATAAEPLAQALKAVSITLADALAALQGFFPAWTDADSQVVQTVYGSSAPADHPSDMDPGGGSS